MLNDGTLLRLFVSQAITVFFVLLLVPIKCPKRKNILFAILGTVIITLINALLIVVLSISFYIRFYFFTLTLPYILLGLWFSTLKGAKFIFAVLTIQVIGNVSIINGLLASYIFFGENTPFIDTIARIFTYLIFLPIVLKLIRPTFIKMTEVIKKGWWTLNSSLIISYALAYYILFVPNSIFNRPLYFVHAYIGIILSLVIYVIIFYLFIEIQAKTIIEHDKELLSSKVSSLKEETAIISSLAYYDTLTGLSNRYSMYKNMNNLILNQKKFLLVFIDLNNLKIINDTYGHSTGDLYLKEFSRVLKLIVNEQGSVYRFAGDEFICLYTHNDTSFNSQIFKDTIANKMLIDVPYYGISLGTSNYPNDSMHSDDLIKLADQAMYVEKRERFINQSNKTIGN